MEYIASRSNRNPVRDSILGLVTGDALGVPVEFLSRSEVQESPVTDIRGYGTHDQPPGTWSDDSSLALCLAEELTSGFDLEKIGKSFTGWFYEKKWTPHGGVFDIGIATRQAIERLRLGTSANLSGNRKEDSNGNGSLTRILPLLLYIVDKSAAERYEITCKVSAITHAHIRSCLACFYYLEFAGAIFEGQGKTGACRAAAQAIKNLSASGQIPGAELGHFARLLSGSIQEVPREEIRSDGYVIHTLEAAVWCVLTTNSYAEAVLRAVNLGDDTDTTGAVTGGLAGLIYGAETIPQSWVSKIARIQDIEDLIQRLTQAI